MEGFAKWLCFEGFALAEHSQELIFILQKLGQKRGAPASVIFHCEVWNVQWPKKTPTARSAAQPRVWGLDVLKREEQILGEISPCKSLHNKILTWLLGENRGSRYPPARWITRSEICGSQNSSSCLHNRIKHFHSFLLVKVIWWLPLVSNMAMKGSFTFLSLLCCFTAKGNSFLIQSKSYKMKYIYQLRRNRKKKERNEKGKWALLTCPCITVWGKLKTHIVSWRLICVRDGWQVFGRVWGEQGCREVSLSLPLAWAAVQGWELRSNSAARLRQLLRRRVPGFKAQCVKERIRFGVHL